MKVVLCGGLVLCGCSEQPRNEEPVQVPTVCAVNYPLAYFAEQIAGAQVKVVFPEIEGDPAFWKPSADEVALFQAADLVLLNGAGYARWVPAASLSPSRLVDTAAGLEERFMALDGAVTHTHGPGGAHAHGELAFTLWLDPLLARCQAEAVHRALAARWSVGDEGIRQLAGDLDELDAALEAAFSAAAGRPLLGSHPVYQYLAERYSLDLQSVHWEPDAEPDQAMWRELEDILETHKADVMLWEDDPLPAVVRALEARGIKSIVFNPCGNRPAQGDYLQTMQENAAALRQL
jgi:zinc transport system substrate-binding protein